MLYLPIFVANVLAGNMVQEMHKRGEEVKGGKTPEIGIVHNGISRPTRLPSILGQPNIKKTRWHPYHHVYRKPSHTGQYLHWDSHHSITNKNVFTTPSCIGPSMSVPTNNY